MSFIFKGIPPAGGVPTPPVYGYDFISSNLETTNISANDGNKYLEIQFSAGYPGTVNLAAADQPGRRIVIRSGQDNGIYINPAGGEFLLSGINGVQLGTYQTNAIITLVSLDTTYWSVESFVGAWDLS